MKHITIRIKTENAAFDPNAEMEIARILRRLCTKLEMGFGEGLNDDLRDFNGNRVGTIEVEE